MSFLKKAINLRKDFLDKHSIGDSLGLLNRAESYLFLKNSDAEEPFEDVFLINKSSKENYNSTEIFSPLDKESDSEAFPFEPIDASMLEEEPVLEQSNTDENKDIVIPVLDFEEEIKGSKRASDSVSFNYNKEEEERFLNNNDFSDLVVDEPLLEDINKNEKNFYLISDKIADELSKLNLKNDSYNEFNKILSDNFNFKKNAILAYSPEDNLFVVKAANGLDDESLQKLKFDIDYKNIYKEVVKKSYLVIIEKDTINGFTEIFSRKDLSGSDFMLIMPFILSNRVIGFFIGLELMEDNDLSVELINTIEIICKQNGALLYNIIQNEK